MYIYLLSMMQLTFPLDTVDQCEKLGVATEVTAVICMVGTASNYIVM